MNECLVTKLKGVVNNDNLVGFGCYRVHVDTTDFDMSTPNYRYFTGRIPVGDHIKVKVIGTGTFGIMNESRTTYTVENVSECDIVSGSAGHEAGWFTIVPNAGVYDFLLLQYNS